MSMIKNPETEDFIVNALFQQIKATLKRDLKKWENQRQQRSDAGKLSAEKRANERATKSNERSNSLNENVRNPTVSVSVNDNVNVNNSSSSIKTTTATK